MIQLLEDAADDAGRIIPRLRLALAVVDKARAGVPSVGSVPRITRRHRRRRRRLMLLLHASAVLAAVFACPSAASSRVQLYSQRLGSVAWSAAALFARRPDACGICRA